jgi:hypothetical protein
MRDYYSVCFYEHAEQLAIKGFGNKSTNPAKRGRITIFSRKARQRIMRLLSTIDISKVIGRPIFLTLTYPGNYSKDYKTWKRDLDNFLKRLYRSYPDISAIWKLELQKRGAPHFHLMLFNVNRSRKYINNKVLSSKIAIDWFEVVGSNDERHLKAGINYQPVETYRAVRGYISKYVAKLPDDKNNDIDYDHLGRYYGVHNREKLPISEVEVELSAEEFHYLRRIARHYLERKTGFNIPIYARSSGFTIYLDYKSCEKLVYFVKDLDL